MRPKLLSNFAGFDTSGADSHTLRAAIDSGSDHLQIGFKTAQRLIMSMADSVSDSRLLPAYFANL